MHIVYVSREYPQSLRGGGIATYLKIMAEGFVSRGHKVTVIAANDDTHEDSDKDVNGVRVIRLSGGDFLIREAEPKSRIIDKFRFLYRFHSYRKKIREEILKLKDIDIIEVAEFGAEGLYLGDLQTPVVYRLHTPTLMEHRNFSLQKMKLSNFWHFYGGRYELKILKKQAKYITSCSSSLKEWVEKYVGIDKTKIKTIYNPLQPDFLSSDSNNPISIKAGSIFFAGTICDWKGAGDLVEACRILHDEGMDINLRMAGKVGVFGEAIRNKFGDCKWLNIMGKIPQSELKQYYRESSVVCFPSWWENMPMVCIEAMGQGAIVIGSDSGGMSEIIEDNESGFLLPPNNPRLWADKIWEVLFLPEERRQEISKKAKQRITDIFSLDRILDETETYFRSISSLPLNK